MKKIKIISIVIGLIVVVLLAIGGVFIYRTQQSLNALDTNNKSVSTKIKDGKPFSILLLGADTGTDGRVDRGNSDTMMLLTLNPKKKKTLAYSIPRDALAEMIGDKTKNVQKINAAYNIGLSKMAKSTVGSMLGVPVDYHIAINMEALEKTVNFVGGVTVTSDLKVSFDGVTIPKGTHHLNGKQALTYARMRYQDPRGDYGRQIRQQQILRAVVKKLETPKYLVKVPDLIKSLGNDISTDLTTSEIDQIVLKYHGSSKKMDFNQIQGQTAWINESSYQVLPTETMQNASDKLRENLGLKKQKLENTETKLNAKNKSFFENDDDTDYKTYELDTTYYTNNTY
ncbi:LytR family transcriptional regulator [Companilactobacillus crustorum]|uniref:LytR family transcriptional regulator n=3 Tax=Companilactobacillus TaxID=2767879 RepID=A0A837RM07_9LACO|nr:LCP family protein [Companilactobacillus crustorum]KRK44561.1 LytR family transcriptional regulator [Companilactobacillus crustorum JCM 15951]KRO21787.1 LytR family transcriptional regulator [Companilactobacillus crustorum]GEO75962.1 LytR family transcriptional regulator [Companilactobacillus crustorum]